MSQSKSGTDKKNAFAVGLGKLRAASMTHEDRIELGKARARKLTKARRVEIARQAAAARWAKKAAK